MLKISRLNREELDENQALFSCSSFMQTIKWAYFKEKYGWEATFFSVSDNSSREGLIVLNRSVGPFSISYIPHPLKIVNGVSLKELSQAIKSNLPKGTLLIRWDLLLEKGNNLFSIKGLVKSPVDVQVPDTTILDISRDEDEILSGMHKKTRYNIRLAAKKGVTVREASFSEVDKWYSIYKETALRDSIAIHSLDYYRDAYSMVGMKLLFAEHEGELLAGIFLSVEDKLATYVYGASSNNKRNLMPSYLLQWEAIRISRSLGAEKYDFFGIAPIENEKHSMAGLNQFKIGFGGDIINRVGCYDYRIHLFALSFGIIEKLRIFYYKKIRK